jgi:hypothetical protein
MLMASMPIAVVMQRRQVKHIWADTVWNAVAVLPQSGTLPRVQPLPAEEGCDSFLVSGLTLELYPDEDDGYFENWIAPEPKIFIMWRQQEPCAMPVTASVSYGEGTRMMDSGESADGVPMPPEIHAWLGDYLRLHYKPKPKRGRAHG